MNQPPIQIEMNTYTAGNIVLGTPIQYNSVIQRCSLRLALWILVPLEIPSGCAHLIICMGCCGKYGNPLTPFIEEVPYEVFYTNKFEKTFAWFTSIIYGFYHTLGTIFTCCGCCGMSCSPGLAHQIIGNL